MSATARTVLAAAVGLSSLVVTSFAPGAAPVAAVGNPDLQLTKSSPVEVLYGDEIPVTLKVTAPTASIDGYNLSFNDVLPVGTNFGSSTPAPSDIIDRVDGTTAVVWENVADLLVGASVSLNYTFTVDDSVYSIGDLVTNSAGAYVSADPREVPDFDTDGANIANAETDGSATATASTTLTPFELAKTEGSREGELLRGVHDNKTVYSLTVDNNKVLDSTGFALVDYLPAGLEFLGCVAVDNSTAGTFEYTETALGVPVGANRRIDATPHPVLVDCPTPTTVTTVTDPVVDGTPLPAGVYTEVVWNSAALTSVLGSATLTAGSSFTIQYAAAIPLRENVQQTLTAATANLDNNTGSLTADEQSLTNHAVVTGATDASTYSDDDVHTVKAEDLSIHKSVNDETFVQGEIPRWKFDIESSEYAQSTDTVITVTDYIPNGLEYTSSTIALAPGFPALETDGGSNPTGRQIVQWEVPAFTTPNSTFTFTMDTNVLANYRAPRTGPVASSDGWSNEVDLAADATIITDNDGLTTPAMALTDDSSAGQQAEVVTILKEVSNPVAGTLTCGDGTTAGLTFDQTLGYDYRAGDRVCFRLSVDFPLDLDTLSPFVKDFLPVGFDYEAVPGFQYGAGHDFGAVTGGNVSAGVTYDGAGESDGILAWQLDHADANGTRFEVIIPAIVDATAPFSNADIKANLMKFSYVNSSGAVFQRRDQADARFVKPLIEVSKTSDAPPPATVNGGDPVVYTVEAVNKGFLDAQNAVITDTLPVGVDCADVTTLGTATCANSNPDVLTWTGVTIPAATETSPVLPTDPPTGVVDTPGTATLNYTVTIPSTFNPGTTLTNSVTVGDYSTPRNTGEPPLVFTSGATASTDVLIEKSTLTKTSTTGLSAGQVGNDAGTQATIGETITYTVTAVVPSGTTSGNPVISDTMPSGVRLDSVTATLNGGAIPADPEFVLASTAAGFTLTLASDGTYENLTGDDTIVVTVNSTVVSGVGNDDLDNAAKFNWAAGALTATTRTSIVEPSLAVAKANDTGDNLVVAGQEIEYTVTVSRTGSSAHDVVVTDTLPTNLTPLSGPAGTPLNDTDTVASGGVWDSTLRTITWQAPAVASLATVNNAVGFVYQAKVANPVVGSSGLTNNVGVTATSTPGANPDERTSYTASTSNTVTAPVISVESKTADVSTATVGDVVTYTVGVRIPASIAGFDVTVLDVLPDGMEYRSLTSVTCAEPGPVVCGPTRTATDLNTPGAIGTIGFFVGDLGVGSGADQLLTLMYTARVANDAVNVTGGADLDNEARVYDNRTDKLGTPTTPPPAGGFDAVSDPQIARVDAVEPTLTIDKDVNGQTADLDTRRATPGETLSYTVTVANTGSSPAHDVTVTDTPDARLTGYAPALPAGVTPVDADHTDGTLSWTIAGPIAPGAANAVAFTYQLTVPNTFDSTQEVAGFEVVNTADVSQYFGQGQTFRDANAGTFRTYGAGAYDVTADTVDVELDLASIGDRVWYDIDGNGAQDTGEPGFVGVGVTVTFLNGAGTADDEVHNTVTGADGIWIVNELPGGSYTVDVDTTDTDLPDGLTVSYDRDQLTSSPDGDWAGTLAEDGDRRDIDAGLTGTGSIGDLVWFDQNENGTQNGSEPGLGGVGVTLVWGGPDDDLSTLGDNVTYTTTTATTGIIGSYDFPRLPAGEYRVTVDGTLPAGMTFVSDPDTGAADGITLVTLGAGTDDNAEDFGASGPYSIGDTVYLDRDGDGTQAVTGEPGLEGLTVTLAYAGADGILDNADDITFTDATDASGNYQFDNLPPEDYRVRITGPLPAGAVNTGDPDTAAPGDSTSVLEITTANDLDQDFGYDVNSTLGDRVWWDLDRDGVQESGEPGLNGMTITATYLGPDGVAGGGDDLVFTTTTAGDGDWSITDIPDGNYTIAASGAPAGFTATFDPDGAAGADSTTNMTLAGSSSVQDFGFAGNSALGDTIWLDLDGDGTINGQEQGIPDVDVTVTWGGPDNNVGTAGDNETFTRRTDDSGNYSVVGLPAGAYQVTVDTATLPANLTVTYDVVNGTATPLPAPGDSVGVFLAADTVRSDVDFGYQGDSSVGDTVYFDRNGDGDRDTSLDPEIHEPGIGGVTVQLIWGGPDGDVTTLGDNDIYTTVTDAAGDYTFTGLPQGVFEVNVIESTLPAGMANTDDEDDDQDSSTPVTLGAAVDHDTADFGYTGAASIGDTIYFDLDGGGQGANEPGVAAQTVRLDYPGPDGILGGANSADDIVLTTVTDANGNYSFDNLPNGTFTVTVVGGITANATNSGDPDAGTANQSQVTIAGGVSNNAQDFGYEGDNAVGDLVWWDTDRDGTDDGALAEPRLAGVDVRISYAGADGIFAGTNAADDVVVATLTTAAAGDYFQSGLPDGNYRVEVITSTLPAGMDATFDADGPATPDGVSLVTLPGATTNSLQDFGYAGTGTIGDVVYFDRDGSGIRENIVDEPGIAGVELTLTFAGADGTLSGAGAADDLRIIQTAGTDGQYDFYGLPAGDYTVEVTGGLPSGAINSDDPDLSGAAPDTGDSTSSVTLTGGENNDLQDFGYDVEAGLGDRVWWDLDRDGVQDSGEPGIPGVTVTATYYGGDGQPDAVSGGTDDEPFTTVTGTDGSWSITEIPDGNYSVELSGVPAGFENTADPDSATEPTDGFTELAGHTGVNIVQDFGLAGNASIGDAVWLDLDGDGTINGGEVGIEGVTVTLIWAGPDGILGGAGSADDLVIPITTGPNGDYLFEGLVAGDYSVTVVASTLPVGLDPSFDRDGTTVTPDGTTTVTLGATDVITDADFGFSGTSSIGDTIFFDRDRDGIQDIGGNGDEPGLDGVNVMLTWAGENGTIGDADDHVFTTVTDADGAYSFDGLPASDYEVDVDTTPLGGLPTGVDNTVDEDGNQNSSTPVTLGVGDDHDTADFGYAGTASIGDTIFVDLDGDGTQNPGEPGVAGQTVTLTGAEGTFTTVTDTNGNYSFDNLPDGNYTVTVVGGIVDSANNTADPDSPVGAGDNAAVVTITGGASIDTIDFGYRGTAALGDTIYFDVDNDGVDDGPATEPRLAGVDVVVTWLGPDGVVGGDDDVVMPVISTDANGQYDLTGLPAGTYTVASDVSDVPDGMIPTTDSDTDGDATSTVTLAAGETDLDQDFAFTGSGSIAGNVWVDGDDDNAFGSDEAGIEGSIVTVTWLGPDGVPGGGDDVVYTTTVADDGSWSVENLPAGEYTVEVSNLPSGVTGPTSSTVALGAGEDVVEENFPYVGSASVGDTVFLDVDGDGVQGPNEPGLGGVTVIVTSAGADGELGTDDDLVVVVVTDDDGTYSVPGLPTGPTTVAIDPATLPPGMAPTGDADGGDPSISSVDLDAGETNVDQDFGTGGDNEISGRIIDEDDGSGIGGVTVTIVYDGPNGPVIFTVVTDDDGGFSVTGLPEGDYTVEIRPENQPAGYMPSGTTTIDVTVVNGERTEPIEFPFVRPASIGDRVFIDSNRNGIQDANDISVAGVLVTLLDEAGNVVATTTTDADGNYLFEDLDPGTYTVVLDPDTLPDGFTLTIDPDGTLDGRHTVTVGPAEDDRSVDFGVAARVVPTRALPATGSGLGILLRTAGLLLAMGLILLAVRRRRHPVGSTLTGG